MSFYLETRSKGLLSLQDEIAKRDPTWWEKVSGVFIGFVNFIKVNMPELTIGFLMGVGARYSFFQPLLGFLLPTLALSPVETRFLEEAKQSYMDAATLD